MATSFEDLHEAIGWGDATAREFFEALAWLAEHEPKPGDAPLVKHLREWGDLSIQLTSPPPTLADPERLARLAELLDVFAAAVLAGELAREAWPSIQWYDDLPLTWANYAVRMRAMIDRTLGRDDAFRLPTVFTGRARDELELRLLAQNLRGRTASALATQRVERGLALVQTLGVAGSPEHLDLLRQSAHLLERDERDADAAEVWRQIAALETDAGARTIALENAANCEEMAKLTAR